MQVNLFFDGLSNGELLTLKTGPPCRKNFIVSCVLFEIHRVSKLLWTFRTLWKCEDTFFYLWRHPNLVWLSRWVDNSRNSFL